jgi:hypothetical protein
MNGRLAAFALLSASALLGGCVEEERVVYVHSVPPPEDAAEVVAVTPGPNQVYLAGHWEWDGNRYVWAQSHYARRPHPHAVWLEGHWQSSQNGWFWQKGHWVGIGKAKPRVIAAPPAQVEVQVPQQAPPTQGDVPPAPTYLPPPPPATPPPPPAATPQRYVTPAPVMAE